MERSFRWSSVRSAAYNSNFFMVSRWFQERNGDAGYHCLQLEHPRTATTRTGRMSLNQSLNSLSSVMMTTLSNQPPGRRSKKPIPPIVYKIVLLIVLVLLVYLVWKMYTRLPPTQPFRYPAYCIPLAQTFCSLTFHESRVMGAFYWKQPQPSNGFSSPQLMKTPQSTGRLGQLNSV